MISFDSIFKLKAKDLGIEKEEDELITLVSHAHTDHLPTKFRDNRIMCSSITKKMTYFRKKVNKISSYKNNSIKMLDAGHILGSKMFLINNELLYTGDFNPQGIYCGKAKPVKCSTLIMETTFGRPQFEFPNKDEVIKEMVDYIKENDKVLITTTDSGFGKPQEICAALEKNKVSFSTNKFTERVNNYLNLKFKYFDRKSKVIITSKYESYTYPSDYKRVFLSGWAKNGFWKVNSYDRGFIYSSHADYPSLIDFVKKCNPEMIYTHHGYAEEFAKDLRKLGFNAKPLHSLTFKKKKKGNYQSRLFDFA